MPFTYEEKSWRTLIGSIVDGTPPEIAAAKAGATVKEWTKFLEDNPARSDEVDNAGLLMLAKIRHQLQLQALSGQAGPAKQVLEAFDEKFQKKTAAEKNRANSEGTRYVIVSDIPPRKAAEAMVAEEEI
jgi:hypothetical protein